MEAGFKPMTDVILSIPKDFSPSPAGRTPRDGPFNGERFRNEKLVPALRNAIEKHAKLIVDFDDADSYSSSFLEEAFGGLIREGKFSATEVKSTISLRASDPAYSTYVADARGYLEHELRKRQKSR